MAQFWKSVVKEGTLESVDHKFLEWYTYMECNRNVTENPRPK
jgi:hypothetical protein